MWTGTPLFPEQASTMAGRVDGLYFFLLALSGFFSLLIAGLIVFYAIKFRRRNGDDVGEVLHGMMALEIGWTVIPFIISMFIFVWGASVYFAMSRPPDETLNVYVVGKQWMWKFQHLDGQREINELHVPVGRPVKLIQDLACNTCHRPDAQGRGPVLEGLFGKTVQLQSGETNTVDEAYVRESI